MDLEKLQNQIDAVNNVFKENRCSFSAELNDFTNYYVRVEIDGGDWKHEHGYADYVMSQHGFTKVKEKITEDTECDWYSSIHYFMLK